MKRVALLVTVVWLCVFFWSGNTLGAPSLDVRKPPAVGPGNTGPSVDPPSTNGQWFLRGTVEEYRTHEFYDNLFGSGGGVRTWSFPLRSD